MGVDWKRPTAIETDCKNHNIAQTKHENHGKLTLAPCLTASEIRCSTLATARLLISGPCENDALKAKWKGLPKRKMWCANREKIGGSRTRWVFAEKPSPTLSFFTASCIRLHKKSVQCQHWLSKPREDGKKAEREREGYKATLLRRTTSLSVKEE